jgi:transcriptional regulator with XRE-family HTH domain
VDVDRVVVESSMPYTFRPHDRRVIGAQVAVGRAIQRARVSQLLSQEALEARSSIDQSTISRLERGLAPGLRLDRLAQILAGLGIDRLDVVFREEPRRSG